MGTVEIVGLLVATGLGLALSNCEMTDFNIAMDVVTEKLSSKTQKVIEILIYTVSLIFWAIVVWGIFNKAINAYNNKWVTATATIPHYPFIFILGLNVFFLFVVLAYKLIFTIKNLSAEFQKSADKEKEEAE